MDDSKKRHIQRLFSQRRIACFSSGIFILLFVPIGIFLVVLRFCLLLNFLIAHRILGVIFREENSIFRALSQLFLAILGIGLKVEGVPLGAGIIVSNKRSHMDGLIFRLALNAFSENYWNLPSFLCSILRLHHKSSIQLKNFEGNKSPVVVFPEGTPTSGIAVMHFDKSYFESLNSVQMATISASRLTRIALTTLHSEFWSDLAWTFFQPITFYTITLSKSCTSKDGRSTEEFAAAIASEIAKSLGVSVSPLSVDDKREYIKALELELRAMKAQQEFKPSPALLQMAARVQDVAPHVPREVILSDLAKTNCIEITLTNIFEGIVKFTPIKPKSEQAKPFHSRSKQKAPATLFEKRKAELYNMARRRYIEKHGL